MILISNTSNSLYISDFFYINLGYYSYSTIVLYIKFSDPHYIKRMPLSETKKLAHLLILRYGTPK